jgi:hypothetical protein
MVRRFHERETGYGTHLAVYWRCGIKPDHVEDYGHKGGDARKGVDLQQVMNIQSIMELGDDDATDPY